MFIHEAIRAISNPTTCIMRESWKRLSKEPCGGVKIQPTNSPDGCIVRSDAEPFCRSGWKPTADDLTADDWVLVRL